MAALFGGFGLPGLRASVRAFGGELEGSGLRCGFQGVLRRLGLRSAAWAWVGRWAFFEVPFYTCRTSLGTEKETLM